MCTLINESRHKGLESENVHSLFCSSGHACPNYDWRGMSSRIEYRGEAASLLSRGAATVCSPGRKPGEDVVFEVKPRRGERSYGICRTYGAHARKGRNPRACARGYILSPLRGFNRMRFAHHFGQQ